MHNLQPNEQQTNRLKQILFPRKQKVQQTYTSNSQLIQTKQNEYRDVNVLKIENASQNLRKQIAKLKESIQNFMLKQNTSFGDNYLKTPRECLELIKFMSEGMVNYNAEIQQAAMTLIQSFPKTNNRITSSKYFVTSLKLSHITSTHTLLKKRKLSQAFQLLKSHSSSEKVVIDFQKQTIETKHHKLYSLMLKKVYKAFSRWRINSFSQQRNDIENYYKSHTVDRILSELQILAQEGRMVVYLERLLNLNADHLEVLVLNTDRNALRGYKVDSEVLTNHFQSVNNQSCLSVCQSQSQSFMQYLANQKIKRIEIPLYHSLTKICIIKKQTLIIEDARKDSDYFSEVDDYTVFYDFSARRNTQGSIFIPILNKKNACIGVIRMYYYGKTLGQLPNNEILATVAESLDNCVKTSQIFQDSKSKYGLIKNACYLKAINFINEVEHHQRIEAEQEVHLFKILETSYNIKIVGKYSYKTTQSSNRSPQIVINQEYDADQLANQRKCQQNEKNREYDKKIKLSNAVSIIKKMRQNNSYFMYENKQLYVCLSGNLYIFESETTGQLKGGQDQNQQSNTSKTSSFIPQNILKELLLRMQQEKQAKEKNHLMALERKKSVQQNIKIAKQQQKMQKMLDFCLKCPDVENEQQLLNIVNRYLSTFSENQKNKAQIVYKNLKKSQNIERENNHILFENQHIQISVPIQQNLSASKSQEINKLFKNIENPLEKLLESKTRKFFETCFQPNLQDLNMKAELYYKKNQPKESFIKLISDIFRLGEDDCKLIQCQSNPYNHRTYIIHSPQNQPTLLTPQSLSKYLRNYEPSKANPLCKKQTFVCYEDDEDKNLKVLRLNKYCHISEENICKIFEVYNTWKKSETSLEKYHQFCENGVKCVKIVGKLEHIANGKLRECFYEIKGLSKRQVWDGVGLQEFIDRENRKLVNYSFSKIKNLQKVEKEQSFYNWEVKIKRIINQIIKISSASNIFQIYKQTKTRQRKLNKAGQILEILKNRTSSEAFESIYIASKVPKINKIFNIQKYLLKTLSPIFEKIKRESEKNAIFSIVSDETECSQISKLDSLIGISAILRKKFADFIPILRSQDGQFFQLGKGEITVYSQFQNKSGYQFLEFAMQSTKSQLSSIIWLIPQATTLSLVQKHYLQVLSKAIQQGYQKSLSKSKQMLAYLNTFFTQKLSKFLSQSFQTLKSKATSQIKACSYSLRDRYYEICVEIENCKQIQVEQKKQEQKRMQEIQDMMHLYQNCQKQLIQNRKANVRFQVMSRKFQEVQNIGRNQRQKGKILRLFNIWRAQAFYLKKYADRRALARKKPVFKCSVLFKIVSWKIKENLIFAYKRMILNSANKKAKQLSQHSQKQANHVRNPTNNRLLTFQDELNEDQNYIKSPQKQRKEEHELSIIPISFKHYEIRQQNKQNYDITEEEAKKLNGGAYKLNTKTLKFLKRMGKLNS